MGQGTQGKGPVYEAFALQQIPLPQVAPCTCLTEQAGQGLASPSKGVPPSEKNTQHDREIAHFLGCPGGLTVVSSAARTRTVSLRVQKSCLAALCSVAPRPGG